MSNKQTMFAAFILLGCSGDIVAPMPERSAPPPPPAPAFLWGLVVFDSGICLEGVTVAVISGQGAGQSQTQQTPCDAWSFGGFWFDGLEAGIAMKLRISAPGFVSLDTILIPRAGSQTAHLIGLRPSPN
jgi:hypothetical protein